MAEFKRRKLAHRDAHLRDQQEDKEEEWEVCWRREYVPVATSHQSKKHKDPDATSWKESDRKRVHFGTVTIWQFPRIPDTSKVPEEGLYPIGQAWTPVSRKPTVHNLADMEAFDRPFQNGGIAEIPVSDRFGMWQSFWDAHSQEEGWDMSGNAQEISMIRKARSSVGCKCNCLQPQQSAPSSSTGATYFGGSTPVLTGIASAGLFTVFPTRTLAVATLPVTNCSSVVHCECARENIPCQDDCCSCTHEGCRNHQSTLKSRVCFDFDATRAYRRKFLTHQKQSDSLSSAEPSSVVAMDLDNPDERLEC